MAYGPALAVQKAIHEKRCLGEIPDVVITVEHDPVITLGRTGSLSHVLATAAALQDEGIEVVRADRGGDATYHGPGQLVVYPIVDLRRYGRDVRGHVDRLESAALLTLAEYGVAGSRRPGYPGVWVGERKIGSVGVAVRRWVTRHGLALNIDVRRDHFAMINPCGLGVDVVSLCELSESVPEISQVQRVFVKHWGDLCGWTIRTTAVSEALAGE
jgi:lipoic acid synthetase